ncbi:hypothetical protein [Desulfobacula toluolica]|uniref:Uncharacterized protein n=1 Tax=Desulfobacula toluolica (strain DSM 7467 / Tol2) TaxID=651182 RepID=K0NQI7_DESTT|nr:hypothetical protein [Desulfobacula toluolica]CCK82423.1 uncharacterized protein TOL2_C42670 [Desulfobacula toluolica Tol2]
MPEQDFIKAIYALAEKFKKAPLTPDEKAKILKIFNSKKGSAFERAKESINEAIGHQIILKRTQASVDDAERLLNDLQLAARKWQKSKGK